MSLSMFDNNMFGSLNLAFCVSLSIASFIFNTNGSLLFNHCATYPASLADAVSALSTSKSSSSCSLTILYTNGNISPMFSSNVFTVNLSFQSASVSSLTSISSASLKFSNACSYPLAEFNLSIAFLSFIDFLRDFSTIMFVSSFIKS